MALREVEARVAELRAQELSQLAIAVELGLSATTVARIERSLGLPARDRGRPATSRNGAGAKAAYVADRQRIRELREQERRELDALLVARYGEPSVEALAADLPVTGQTVWRRLKRLNVELRAPGRRPGVAAGPHREETKTRISDGLRAWYRTPAGTAHRAWASARLSDPAENLRMQAQRQDRGPDFLRRAIGTLAELAHRPRVGRPKLSPHHDRWVAMYSGEDAELEELLDGLNWSRTRALAFLDWQRHPADWPRESYPPAKNDPDSIDPFFLPAAEDRVRKALSRRGVKPLQTPRTKRSVA